MGLLDRLGVGRRGADQPKGAAGLVAGGGIFEAITLAWKGREYVIPPNGVMRAIAIAEDILTLAELNIGFQRGAVPLAKLAMAYAAVLRYAGAEVSDEEVYAQMFGQASAADMQLRAVEVVRALQILMIPPPSMRKAMEEAAAAGKVQASPQAQS